MPSSYSITEYLLDRANIHDTTTKLGWYYDTRSESGLANEVFAPEVWIDYSKILGGEPLTARGPEWARQVIDLVEAFDSTQHLYGHFIIELPQPGSSSRPERCRVLCQGGASMVLKGAGGGPLLQNGAQAIIEVLRLPALEAEGVNPWRICKQAVTLMWEQGNKGVIEGMLRR